MLPRRIALLVIGLVGVGGCGRRCGAESPPPVPSRAGASGVAPVASAPRAPSRPAERSDLLPGLGDCQVSHRGLLFDLGTPGPNGLRGFRVGPFPDTQDVERGGATLARVFGKRVAYDFWLDQDQEGGVFVSARVHGVGARSLWVEIDGRRMGTARLTQDKTEVLTLPAADLGLARGRHSIALHFTGQARDVAVPAAELDWLRIARTGEPDETYAPPTMEDIVTNYELGGQPRRSLVLRAPSTVRCAILPGAGARLVTSLGFWGKGKGTAEVRLVEDGQPPLTLQQRKVIGGADARWLPLGIELGPYEGRVVGIELRAVDATPGGRIVFGDPSVVRKSQARRDLPPAKTVVIVLASGLDRRRIPPWGPMGRLTALGELVRSGVTFTNYRVPTTVPAAVVASVLSGLEPHSHTLEDPSARLPDGVRTVSAIVKAATGRTAFFSGVPTTFAPFGFNVGWDRFETFSPMQDLPATEPYDRAAQWIDETSAIGAARRFLFVHVRGAHPPWDLSAEEVARLPPEEYGGALDTRRGGVTLAKLRGRSTRTQRKLTDEDWVRLRALEEGALAKQNDGLAKLIDTLKSKAAWDDTLFVFAGDVALGDPLRVPFDPAPPLTDDVLLTPLLVKFPGGALAGTETKIPVASADLAVTALEALGLDIPKQVSAENIFRAAAAQAPLVGRAFVSTLGPGYVTRAESWLLSGEVGKIPKLCQLDVDPACTTDLVNEKPLVSQWLWRATYRYQNATVAPGCRVGDREPASIDPSTAAALLGWGDVQ
jgi:arylsulfatase A-like enzyme